jgi:hypothetical protein
MGKHPEAPTRVALLPAFRSGRSHSQIVILLPNNRKGLFLLKVPHLKI